MANPSIITVAGRNKEALQQSQNLPVTFTDIALGTGDRYPGGGETALQDEVYRGAITGSGTDANAPNVYWFDLYVPASVPTMQVREMGLFDEDGILYAITRFPSPAVHFGPGSAGSSDNTYRINVVVADTANINVTVSPIHALTSDRQVLTDKGLAGGGDLSTDRTIVTDWSNLTGNSALAINDLLNIRQKIGVGGEGQTKVTLSALVAFIEAQIDSEKFLASVGGYNDATNVLELNMSDGSTVDVNLTALITDAVNNHIPYASNTETQADAVDNKAVTPASLASRSATTTRTGLVELATNAETQAGADANRSVTPAGLASRTATATRTGIMALATNAETNAGAIDDKAVTPAALAQRTATTTRKGLVEQATAAEAKDGAADKYPDADLIKQTYLQSSNAFNVSDRFTENVTDTVGEIHDIYLGRVSDGFYELRIGATGHSTQQATRIVFQKGWSSAPGKDVSFEIVDWYVPDTFSEIISLHTVQVSSGLADVFLRYKVFSSGQTNVLHWAFTGLHNGDKPSRPVGVTIPTLDDSNRHRPPGDVDLIYDFTGLGPHTVPQLSEGVYQIDVTWLPTPYQGAGANNNTAAGLNKGPRPSISFNTSYEGAKGVALANKDSILLIVSEFPANSNVNTRPRLVYSFRRFPQVQTIPQDPNGTIAAEEDWGFQQGVAGQGEMTFDFPATTAQSGTTQISSVVPESVTVKISQLS